MFPGFYEMITIQKQGGLNPFWDRITRAGWGRCSAHIVGLIVILYALFLPILPGFAPKVAWAAPLAQLSTDRSIEALPLGGHKPLAVPPQASPPIIGLNLPGTTPIGSDVGFTVTFNNPDPTDPGYGPVIDVILDTTGADGDDGLGTSSISASYAGIPFTTGGSNPTMWILTFNASGQAIHPLFRDSTGAYITVDATAVGASAGDTLVVLRLPFGSFASDQPPASVNMSVNMSNFADLSTPLTVWARGGYEFGYTPMDDWCCGDAAYPAAVSGWSSSSVTPTVLSLSKSYNGPEDETATGPNYTRRYTVTASIALGQSLTSFALNDIIPNNMQFDGLVSSSPGGATCSTPGGVPDGTLTCGWASPVSGSPTLVFDFYIPLDDLSGSRVLNESSGAAVDSCNNASASGDWDPLDPRDPPTSVSVNPAGCEHTLSDQSIAIQKGFTNLSGGSNSAGDTLRYTLDVQVSDFFAFDGVLVSDVISDGQHVDPGFIPTLTVAGNGFSLSALAFDSANFDVVCNYTGGPGGECTADNPAANDGTTELVFRISDEVVTRGQPSPGRLIGGCIDPSGGTVDPDCAIYNDGATTATIQFQTIIQDDFTDDYPSGDTSVDQGDVLGDGVDVSGYVLNTSTFVRTGGSATDDSSAGLSIGTGDLSKTVYALNGAAPGNPVEVKPGDELTYRITYTLPTSDEENLEFRDYLPLPIFHVDDPDEDGSSGPAWTFNPVKSTGVGDVPNPGVVMLGPSDTFYQYTCDGLGPPATGIPPGCLPPALTSDATNNLLRMYYGDFNDSRHQSTTVDLLFTVTVSADPFADRLYLTNQAQVIEGSTNAGTITSDEIVQIVLTEPVLVSEKGVIWIDNPNGVLVPDPPGPVTFLSPVNAPRWNGVINSTNLAASPIDSDLEGVDAEDVVSFAIVIENTGSSLKGAFDIILRDDLPAEYQEPPGGYNLQVYYGDSTDPPIPFTYPSSGPPCTDPGAPCGPDGIANTDDDIFGYGIELVDPVGGQGVCQSYDPNSGNNIILVTFDLQLRDDVVPGNIVNTSSLVNYAGEEGGPNHLPEPQTDTAEVRVIAQMEKALLGTEIDNAVNAGDQVVIGELVYYSMTFTVPEAEIPDAQIVDTMDPGLAFIQVDSVTATPGLSIENSIGTGTAPANVTIGNAGGGSGNQITFNLGDVINPDRDNSVAETIVINYTAVAVNSNGNQRGTSLNNSAVLSWTRGSETLSRPAVSAPNVTVIEPDLQVLKTAIPDTGDAGDTITLQLDISHTTISDTDAFDIALTDTIPAGMTYLAGTLDCTLGVQDPLTCGEAGGTVTATWLTFLNDGTNALFQLQVRLDDDVAPGQVITNTANLSWTSLSGDVTSPRSNYSGVSTERTGDITNPGGAVNDYRASGSDSVVVAPGSNKFLVSTSESHTADPAVVIGEIVRYRMEMILPEGVAPNFQVQDLLPNGILYLDDNTTRVAFVANDTGISSSTLSGVGLNVIGSELNVASITPTFLLPGSAISGGPFSPGTDPVFSLGTLTNSDRDDDLEYVVLEFNALISNVASNQAGTSLPNEYQILIDGVIQDTSDVVTVIVAEPDITVTKTVNTFPADAGDIARYDLTFTNSGAANSADAFDIIITDTFNAYLTVTSATVTSSPGYATITDNSNGNLVSYSVDRLNTGDSIVVGVVATVNSNTPVGQDIPNTAYVTYTSLPGTGTAPNPTGSIVPGGSGAANGERDGSGGVNDYSTNGSGDLTLVAPSIDKQVSPPGYVIGDQLEFNVIVTLKEGITLDFEFYDDIPVGLAYLSHQVITTAAGSGGLLTADFNGTLPPPTVTAPGGNGGDLTLDFGDTTTSADNNPANDSILIRINAQVLNVAGNQNGVDLTNTAEIRYTANGSPASVSDSVTITILEPELDVGKSADDITPALGQTVTYTITVTHLPSSTSDAFDIEIEDTVPAGMTYVGSSLPSAQVDATGDPLIVFTIPSLTLAAGNTSFTYTAMVDGPGGSVAPGDVLTNAVVMTWTSLSGTDSEERTGAGGINDYRDTTSAPITVTGIDLVITKDDGVASAQPRDLLTYTLAYQNVGNTAATGVTITDVVPTYSTFNPGTSTFGWVCSPDNNAGSTCTYTFANPVPAGASASVDFAVTIDSSVPSGVTQIDNTVVVTDDGNNGPEPTPGNNTDQEIAPLDAVPDLTIVKDDGLDIVAPGSLLTYVIDYSNVGDQDATGVVITETVPNGTAFSAASSLPTVWSCPDGSTGGTSCTVTVGALAAGASGTLNFAVVVDDPIDPAITQIVDTVAITDDGSNGPDPTPGNNTDTDIDFLVTLPNADLTKTLTGSSVGHTTLPEVAIGEVLTYTIDITIPPGNMVNAVLTDSLDRGLAFWECTTISPESGLSTTVPPAPGDPNGFVTACNNPIVTELQSGSAAPEDQGRQVQFDFGTVTNSDSVRRVLSLSYTVVVLDNSQNIRGISLQNDAVLTWTGGRLQEQAAQVTAVEPTLTLQKAIDPTTVLPGGTVTITLSVGIDPSSDTDAFDLVLTDTLPPELTYIGGLTVVSGVPPTTMGESGGTVTAAWDAFPLGSSSVISFQAQLSSALGPGASVTNSARLEWSSLPGDVSAPQSPYNSLSTERYYDPGSLVNIYGVVASAVVTTPSLPDTGFAPNRYTPLPSPAIEYKQLPGLWLEIPSQDLQLPVVGVPLGNGGWDITWLGRQAGYLEGSTYPTQLGTTLITAHVYMADGRPGPFVDIGQLDWGDEVILHAEGAEYVYRVTSKLVVRPDDLSLMIEDGYYRMILITCKGYEEAREEYAYRMAMQTVLVEIR